MASQVLINNKLYTSSVHCSYYAVLQYMKYILHATTNSPIPYQSQDDKNVSSHEYLLTETKNRINKPKDAKSFAEEFRFLKGERVRADYNLEKFTDVESLDCRQKADSLISKLKTYFGNI